VEVIQENVADLLVIGEIYHDSFQFQRALENLEPARELQSSLISHLRSINAPTTSSASSTVGFGSSSPIGSSESASYDYLSGVSAECTLAHVYYVMGNAYMQLDDTERAVQMFSDALSQYPTHEVFSLMLLLFFNVVLICYAIEVDVQPGEAEFRSRKSGPVRKSVRADSEDKRHE
jgi:tetratricopeptide (TPR) repeat protein